MNTSLNYLFRVEPPWISIGAGELARSQWNPSQFYSRPGLKVCVRRLRGQKMQTVRALMDEFSAALQFFDGFGANWMALRECLQYLDEWLPAEAYVLVIENAEEVLSEEQACQMDAFLRTIHEVGEWWAHPIVDNGRFNRKEIPFHVLLNLANDEPAAVNRFLRVAGEAGVSIRRD